MIKTILGHLQNGVDKLESGQLTPEDMELLVEDAKELYERLIILRYKIYETNVLGVNEPVISASLRQPEIETPIDLFGSMTEPRPEPEFEVTFANGEEEDEEEVEEEEVVEEEILEESEEEAVEEIVEEVEEDEVEEEIVEEVEEEEVEDEDEQEIVDEEVLEEEQVLEAPAQPWEPQFSNDQPIWMAEMEANIRDNRSVYPLDSLIGAFTLNEKLQFINELFDGSSDDFSNNIKQLDQLASMDAARNMLAELANTFNWDTESEIVEDFIFKICRRHAAGA
ncbi:MAG: hypothetical protein ACKO5N_05125 [Sphingomonadales bacterium]